MGIDKVIELINDEDLGSYKENVPMSNHTSVKTGGMVPLLVMPSSIDAIVKIVGIAQENDIQTKIIGRGSNILFPDNDMNVIIIKISNVLQGLSIDEGTGEVTVGAGYSFQKLAKQLSKKGFSGLEFGGGIPGTVGGAVYMNAGAHTGVVSDVVDEVVYLDEDLKMKSLTREGAKFSYRTSIFQSRRWIILEVKLKLSMGDTAEIFKKMSGNLEYRKVMQPLEWPSFGSVFRNPPGGHAGKIIEELGLKGYQIGGAKISDKHANFIINDGNATTEEVKRLIKYIQDTVKDRKGVVLETEVEMFLDGNDE